MKTLFFLLFSYSLFAQSFKHELESYLEKKIQPGKNCKVVIAALDNYDGLMIDEQRNPVIGKETALIPVLNLQKNKKQSFISVKFEVFAEVLIAQKSIKAKTLLKNELFRKGQISLSKLNGKTCFAEYDLANRRAAKLIAEGEVLKEEFIEILPDINMGDKVSLEVHVNKTILTTDAFARQNGSVGDIIKVNFKNRVLSARVIDSKKVRIE